MKMFGHLTAIAMAVLTPVAANAAPAPAKPLFASDELIRLTITGPISALARSGDKRQASNAVLTLAGATGAESHPIQLTPRGITRLKREVCQFPPLRVDFNSPPPQASLFNGQRRLKLVTHCRAGIGFQQHLLLEYAAYRLYNQLTPESFRVRLAMIDYVNERGQAETSRLGFFIEDLDDVAMRNGVARARVGTRIAQSQLSPREAARFAMFEYMISNLDWSMRAGPEGDGCCHNGRLIPASNGRGLAPVPYDFDFAGLVDAPYATPPAQVPVRNVRTRYYRGYCAHNGEALASAADFRAKRPAFHALINQIPQLDERTRRKAAAFLDTSLADFADNQTITAKLFKTCVK